MLCAVEIGVLGATGPAGTGIAARLASVGHDVIAGSRERARADAAVAEMQERWGDRVATLRGGTNADAAGAADLVVLATTWQGVIDTAHEHRTALAGKVMIAMANGIEKHGREFRVVLPEHGSLAEAVQAAAPGRTRRVGVPPRAGVGVRSARPGARERCRRVRR